MRNYRDKTTGELLQTEAGKRIQFRPGVQLQEMIHADAGKADAGADIDEADEE